VLKTTIFSWIRQRSSVSKYITNTSRARNLKNPETILILIFSHRVISPPTCTHCNYEGVDQCLECGLQLPKTDYYRTRFKVKVFDLENPPKDNRHPAAKHVSLCRKCYCHALRGSHKLWKRQDILWLFRKTRHCSYIHKHNQMPIATMKTSCAMVKRLTRKEACMAKYFPDKCERTLKEVEWKKLLKQQ